MGWIELKEKYHLNLMWSWNKIKRNNCHSIYLHWSILISTNKSPISASVNNEALFTVTWKQRLFSFAFCFQQEKVSLVCMLIYIAQEFCIFKGLPAFTILMDIFAFVCILLEFLFLYSDCFEAKMQSCIVDLM